MAGRYEVELFLKQAEPFKKLPSKERERLASESFERTYTKGEILFHEGRPSDSVWLVMEGRVHLLHYLSEGQVRTTCVMVPGDTFCCLPALDRGTYPATAVAATKAKVLQIPARLFHGLMEGSADFLKEALCLFCSRLRQVEAKGCLAHEPAEQRIVQALLTLQKKFGLEIPLTRREIAELSGTTMETAIRVISRFEKRGWVRSRRGKLMLLQPDRLRFLRVN